MTPHLQMAQYVTHLLSDMHVAGPASTPTASAPFWNGATKVNWRQHELLKAASVYLQMVGLLMCGRVIRK